MAFLRDLKEQTPAVKLFFPKSLKMSQVFYIYWQAWGHEQAQLRKQLYIKKTSIELDKIIKSMYINAVSKVMIFNYPTPELRNKDFQNLMLIPKNINYFMKDLDFLSKMCLQDKLPLYELRGAHPKYSIYTRSRSRIFRPLVNQIPKQLNINSVIRVDAILCLF